MTRKKADQAKNTTKIRTKIMDAALKVAKNEPWEFVSPLDIAAEADLSLAEVQSEFADKDAILAAIIDDLDHTVAASFIDLDRETPLRDRLFDVFMERLDLANQHREAHKSFLKSFGWTKASSCQNMAMMKTSMERMAAAAGLDPTGPKGLAITTLLTGMYGWVVMTWLRDESRDLSRTMAQLDKTLGYAERALIYAGISLE